MLVISWLACSAPSVEDTAALPQAYQPGEPQAVHLNDPGPAPARAPKVVIIGGGPAGLSAAMDLPDAILFEASPELGGRAKGAGQLLFVLGSQAQAEQAPDLSWTDAYDLWPALTGAAPTEATEAYLQALPETVARLEALGLSLHLNPPDPWVGLHALAGADEPGLPATLEAALPSDLEVRLSSPVLGICIEEGRVCGVETAEGLVRADVVLIASGGFANRLDLVQLATGWPEGSWRMGGDDFAQGDAAAWAQQYRLGLARMEAMSGYIDAIAWPQDLASGRQAVAFTPDGPTPFILVDAQGQRFVDEGQSFSVFPMGALDQAQQEGQVFGVSTLELLERRVPQDDSEILETLVCADDWPDLALELDWDPDTFRETMGTLGPARSRIDLDGTPCAFLPGVSSQKSFGGLWVDEHQRVLDLDGNPVAGLYAAGEAAGMAVPGMGGDHGFDGSLSAVVWSGWRAAEAIQALE